MIRLEMDEKQVNKVMDIYDQSCYHYKKETETSLFDALRKRINRVIKIRTEDSDRIVSDFLKKYFTDGRGRVTTQKVREYLQKKEITEIIVGFWVCVAEIWLGKLRSGTDVRTDFIAYLDGVTAADLAEKLSKWDGVRQYVMQQKKNGATDPECLEYVGDIITMESFPLFHIPNEQWFIPDANHLQEEFSKQMGNQKPFDVVKFRYHTDVFGRSAGKKTPAIKGALEKLGEIFDYDLLAGSPRHQILSAIYVPVCPYCNRQYITKYGQIGQEESTADLDHFYHKSLYPFLALSVYNFVPSCSICNRTFKGTVDFYATPHLYPYAQKSNAEMKFKLADIHLLWDIQRWKNDGVEKKLAVEVKPGKNVVGDRSKAVVNNARAFHLQEVYQSHTDQVFEILCKALVYSDKRIEELYEAFEIIGKNGSSKLFAGKEEIRDMIFGQYLDDEKLHERPLAKMTHDLLEDLLPEIEEIKRKRGWQA